VIERVHGCSLVEKTATLKIFRYQSIFRDNSHVLEERGYFGKLIAAGLRSLFWIETVIPNWLFVDHHCKRNSPVQLRKERGKTA
jgi:hypothetical protein